MRLLQFVVILFLFTAYCHGAYPVNVTVYMESHCIDTQRFIVDELWPTYKRLSSSNIMKIELVPFGKAKVIKSESGDDVRFKCHHGNKECRGNQIFTCALRIKSFDAAFPFIVCMEKKLVEDYPVNTVDETAHICARINKVPIDVILNCADSVAGHHLEYQMARKTESLVPPVNYVPTIVINDERNKSIQTRAEHLDLLELICEMYTGQKPKACTRGKKPRSVFF